MSAARQDPSALAASLRQRLRNLANERGTDFRLVLERYGAERFLFRLGKSAERDRFILKGAMLLQLWADQEFRATRDVDLLARGPIDRTSIRHSIELICVVNCPEDGVRFDTSTITVTDIQHDQEYGGIRVKMKAWLGAARIDLQIDVGTGDAVTPYPADVDYPTLLDQPVPQVRTYPRETFIAEKLEAMVRLGPLNTRMKDFWDVAALASCFEFDGELLQSAVAATFKRRQTILPKATPVALTTEFYSDGERVQRWLRFRSQVQPKGPAPVDFCEAGGLIRDFLEPIFRVLLDDEPLLARWTPATGWRAKGA